MMANFFHVQDRADLGGVLFTRIYDPALMPRASEIVYLAADPVTGTWQPLPPACNKINTTGIVNKMAVLVPYS